MPVQANAVSYRDLVKAHAQAGLDRTEAIKKMVEAFQELEVPGTALKDERRSRSLRCLAQCSRMIDLAVKRRLASSECAQHSAA